MKKWVVFLPVIIPGITGVVPVFGEAGNGRSAPRLVLRFGFLDLLCTEFAAEKCDKFLDQVRLVVG